MKTINDTGIQVQSGNGPRGYTRQWIVVDWHPERPSWLARLQIGVRSAPTTSWAEAWVWTQAGWQPLGNLPVDDWWGYVPAYSRAGNHDVNRTTARILEDLAENVLQPLAAYATQ